MPSTTDIELVEVAYDGYQNDKLADSFREFYKLADSPKIKKSLVVEKAVYNKFLKSRTKIRTQFEPQGDGIDLTFDDKKIPFEFVGTKTEFVMPSGKVMTLNEELDAPGGLTKIVKTTYGDEKQEFQSYFQAEVYALGIYLKERG